MSGSGGGSGGIINSGVAGLFDIGSALASIFGGQAAAKAAQNATNQNVSTDQALLNEDRTNLSPSINVGNQSANALAGLLGIGGNPAASAAAFNNFRNSTNYQFLLNQGLQSQGYLNAPNLLSGATGKALNNYAQGMAGNALQGYEGLLQGEQGMGINAALGFGQLGNQNAALQQSARQYGANAQGVSDYNTGNALSSMFQGFGNLAGQYSGFPSGNPYMSSSFSQTPAFSSSGILPSNVNSAFLPGTGPIGGSVALG